ncbi:hypothetical protein RB196_01950 [Streptomyces sp. PmtA]|uniref:hypothetical protein n=1 Tax=Streptomyces sp. PmtA TaxID=3074275 RepID=UPI003014D164
MKIASFHTRVVRAPYRRPFAISSGTSPELVSLLVEVRTTDGASGFGEASPMTAYTGETLAGLRAALTEHAAPALIGRDPRDLAGAHAAMDAAIRGQHLAKAALDLALHDLAARAADWPAHLLLGGAVTPSRAHHLGRRTRQHRGERRGGGAVRRVRLPPHQAQGR